MAYGSLNTDIVQSSATGVAPQFNDGSGVQVGTLCRAWVNFNGTTSPGTIRASFNVGSVTKNGTGDYTANFINAMTDANYVATVSGNAMSNGSGNVSILSQPPYNSSSPSGKTTTGVRIVAQGTGGGGAAVDFAFVDVSIFR